MVESLDSRSRGGEFDSRLWHRQVTTLGMLFTSICFFLFTKRSNLVQAKVRLCYNLKRPALLKARLNDNVAAPQV